MTMHVNKIDFHGPRLKLTKHILEFNVVYLFGRYHDGSKIQLNSFSLTLKKHCSQIKMALLQMSHLQENL